MYQIVQFEKPNNHKKGGYNKDVKLVSPVFPNIFQAEKYLYDLMNKYRQDGKFLRIDRGVRYNPVVYADLNSDGGLVRFKHRDGIHWTSAITLPEFRQKLTRMAKYS